MSLAVNLSPCIGCCRLDDDSICTGCFRSLDEIRDWRLRSRDEQQEILRNVADRRMNKHQLSFMENPA